MGTHNTEPPQEGPRGEAEGERLSSPNRRFVFRAGFKFKTDLVVISHFLADEAKSNYMQDKYNRLFSA